MSFVRPEAIAGLKRWREVLIGLAVTMIGLWWVLRLGGLLFWVGLLVIPMGLVLAMLGLQRARFRIGSAGPGIVQIDEGRIVYFGPLTGGVADLAFVTEVRFDPSGRPAHWALFQDEQPTLYIPVNSTGAETLLDAFAMLPGFPMGKALSVQKIKTGTAQTVWRRDGTLKPRLELAGSG